MPTGRPTSPPLPSLPATASSSCTRTTPNVDYVYYLKGLINFNEDLGLLGHVSAQDPTERDPKSAKDAFDAFRNSPAASRTANTRRMPSCA